tara:strand:- start:270 stop:1160 length:891 start_codon:yes stop_codon:yes gene_type:complete
MKFVITSSQKILKLIEIFKVIKNLSSDCTLYCKDEYIYIQTMDSSHVCLLDIKLLKNWFDDYDLPDGNETVSFSSNLIVKILALFIPKTKLIIQTSKNGDNLLIELIYPDKIEKTFEIPLMDINQDYLETGDNDYSIEFSMKTKILDKYVNEMMLFGDVLRLKCMYDNLYMCSGDNINGNYKVKIPHDNLEELEVEENLKMSVKVDLKYISFISKFYGVFNIINIKSDTQFPMKFYFNEGSSITKSEDMDENDLQITYFIAPKIDEDEYLSDEEEDASEEEESIGDISETNEIIES